MIEGLRVSSYQWPASDKTAWHLARFAGYLAKWSNSPFRAPPRKACHSPGVNWSTGPEGSLESRTPTPPSGRLATSTQFPLLKLRELLIQDRPSGRSPSLELATSLPPE